MIATNATIRSMAYCRAILARCDTAKVFASAAPMLVPLVEQGWCNHRATPIILREYLSPLRRHRIDTLILACTHFPLLKDAIRKVVGDQMHLVDCSDTCAAFTHERLKDLNLLCSRNRPGRLQTFVTDEPERFTRLARRFLGEEIEPALQVLLPPFKMQDEYDAPIATPERPDRPLSPLPKSSREGKAASVLTPLQPAPSSEQTPTFFSK